MGNDENGQIDGMFRGLGRLLRLATELAEGAQEDGPSQAEVRRGRVTGIPKTLHAVYGVSVRVGPGGAPVVHRFGNVRQNGRKEPVVEDSREPLADVLDEDDHYIVVVELPGVAESSVKWELRDGQTLFIRAGSAGRRYNRHITLVERVDETTAVACYENGMLELKLWKLR